MATKWRTMLAVAWKRFLIVLWGYPSNFKATGADKSTILTQIEDFRTITPVWIHRWLWNNAQSVNWYGRDALWFFKTIRQISRSHEVANWRFLSELRVSRMVTPIWIHRCLWNDTASRAIEEVPFCCSRTSFKLQGHRGRKIDDFDLIWARLLGQSQVSNSPNALLFYTLLILRASMNWWLYVFL